MLVAMAFAGAASAVAANGQDDGINVLTFKQEATLVLADETRNGFGGAASADSTDISTFADLKDLMKNGGEGKLKNDIIIGPGNSSYVNKDVTLDLNGSKLILGAETSSTPLDATITVNEGVQFNLINSKGVYSGNGGFYNNGHLIANGAVDVSTIQWNLYHVAPNTSFTWPDWGGVVFGLNGTFAIGAEGSLKIAESHDKSPNLIMAANDKMLSSSKAGAKFIILMDGNDKTYVAAKNGKDLVWIIDGTEPVLKVTGICDNPIMGELVGTEYSEFVETMDEAHDPVEKMKDGTITIKLIDSLTMTSVFEVDKSLTVDLNGNVLTAGKNLPMFIVTKGVSLTLDDTSSAGTGKLLGNGKVSENGGAVSIIDKSAFIMKSGQISGFETSLNGGAIYVAADGKFSMLDGIIKDCSADENGGGVYLDKTATISLSNNATISGCKAMAGAGIFVVENRDGDLQRFVLEGTPVVLGNYNGNNIPNNIYLNGSQPDEVTCEFIFNGGKYAEKIGITTEDGENTIVYVGNNGGKILKDMVGKTLNYLILDNPAGRCGKVIEKNGRIAIDFRTEITYSVSFNANQGTGDMDILKFDNYAHEQELTPNTFERNGYSFVGWNTKADGTGTSYADKQKVSKLSPFNQDIVTLYAQWKQNPQPYTPHHETGQTQIKKTQVQDVNADPTAKPTVEPTVQPIEKPTVKPTTTQPTQKSPAPFVGLIAGLGAAAVLIRMRR